VVVKGHRQRQAMQTRQQVAAAARRLFAEHGYVATTIAAIAAAADIPAPTIYSAFGGKKQILDEIMLSWIAEADTRRLHDAALAELDPPARMRAIAHFTRRQLELGLDILLVYQEAARVDPAMAIGWRETLAGRERMLAVLLDSFAGHLAPGVDRAEAMDRFVACTTPEIYRTLVAERGWSPERFEHWLGDLLVHQLLERR
jgi:AcrR family transcriptional regulator